MVNKYLKFSASNAFSVLIFLLVITQCFAILEGSNHSYIGIRKEIVESKPLLLQDGTSIKSTKFKRSSSKMFPLSLTTAATPVLTTMRYFNKSYHQHQINYHHRNYELDLERDHALPTSAPNADILKSNSNPTYPNPNRHHSHDRDRNRFHSVSTPQPMQTNLIKSIAASNPTNSLKIGGEHQVSPGRSFFTPPLPPEYQHPFADKPTLRGSNNDVVVLNTGAYINRRPIPPPSLMPGHERIPLRPPDFTEHSIENITKNKKSAISSILINDEQNPFSNHNNESLKEQDPEKKENFVSLKTVQDEKEVLPSIRRILSGSNDKKVEIPEVLLNQVTKHPIQDSIQPTTSPVLFLENIPPQNDKDDINATKNKINSFPAANRTEISNKNFATTFIKLDINKEENNASNFNLKNSEYASNNEGTTIPTTLFGDIKRSSTNNFVGSTPSTITNTSLTTWVVAWNVHVYLSVVLFTILSVYSLYKILIYNKLTFLFSQSYFICVNLLLVSICFSRIFYLCYDAYNLQDSFNSFLSDLLLNLPATLLTTTFAVLVLFLFLKSLNHKNNRYSALIRPLTVVIGCGVHVVLCITLHYVESYTNQNQQRIFNQQQQQFQINRKIYNNFESYIKEDSSSVYKMQGGYGVVGKFAHPPARVLSLICQIIYIFVCLSLGLLYIYLYRVLKRILQSKSQNYIHGHQTLSYGIHITIATALLSVLLGALQIFGAISISTQIIPKKSSEMDWLQWGYQFSLRLVEIAMITLLLWVAGLKINSSRSDVQFTNNSVRMVGTNRSVFQSGRGILEKDKGSPSSYSNQNNLHGFFFSCASKSQKEQLENDYPAVCNANTNLHNYTLRTGKLIYNDNFPHNAYPNVSLKTEDISNGTEFHSHSHSQSNYQYPYDNEHFRTSDVNISPNAFHQLKISNDCHHYSDCVTEAIDHYENPNFDLQVRSQAEVTNSNAIAPLHIHTNQDLDTKSTENWYAEPNENHKIKTFKRPSLNVELDTLHHSSYRQNPKKNDVKIFSSDRKKNQNIKQMNEKLNKRNHSNSARFITDENSFKTVPKNLSSASGSIDDNPAATSINSCRATHRHDGVDTMPSSEHFRTTNNRFELVVATPFNDNSKQRIQSDPAADIFLKQKKNGRYAAYFQNHDIRQNSDEDDIISGSNVECTNLINNEDGTFIKSKTSDNQAHPSMSNHSEKSAYLRNACSKNNPILQSKIHSNPSNLNELDSTRTSCVENISIRSSNTETDLKSVERSEPKYILSDI